MKKKALILLSDSDPVLRTVYKNKFAAEAGWESIMTSSAKEAFTKIKKEKPAVIVTDIILDSGDGYELLENVRTSKDKKTASLPFVFLTELRQEEEKKRAKELGLSLYLVKSEITLTNAIAEIKKLVK